ncbi:hypothetical protein ACG7TL_007606 [Trametes sanguinea]
MSSLSPPKCIVETSLYERGGHKPPTVEEPLDLTVTATKCKLRLVDCNALCHRDFKVRILEFDDFPSEPYAAVSYPWRGVSNSGPLRRFFHVRGAEQGADPVGGVLLFHACAAAIAHGCPYLWIDRLCIMQTSKEDKHWQIRHMHQVYKSCKVCIVLPGGLQRITYLDEPTPWIHRSWTLQETLAPPESIVLFRWRPGPGTASVAAVGSFPIVGVPRAPQVVMLPLRLVLAASTVGSMTFTPEEPGKEAVSVRVSMFSAHPPPPAFESSLGSRPRILATNVSALSMAMEPEIMADPDRRAHAVWQSSLMRTSSRPVDMVFSIMGLFGVELDPGAFHEDDRRGATIALARAILQAGGRANWLGVACRVPPERTLSSFPTLPRTSVGGLALVQVGADRVQEVSELMDPTYPVPAQLVPLPTGDMDGNGFLTVSMKAAPAWQADPSSSPDDSYVLRALDGSSWQLTAPDNSERSGRPAAYVSLLGWFHRYYPSWVISEDDTRNIRLMLLELHQEQAERRSTDGHGNALAVHTRSFFSLDRQMKETVQQWTERRFRIGPIDGSDHNESVVESGSSDMSSQPVQNYYEDTPPWPAGSKGNTFVNECMRQAEAALPYTVVQERLMKPTVYHPDLQLQ